MCTSHHRALFYFLLSLLLTTNRCFLLSSLAGCSRVRRRKRARPPPGGACIALNEIASLSRRGHIRPSSLHGNNFKALLIISKRNEMRQLIIAPMMKSPKKFVYDGIVDCALHPWPWVGAKRCTAIAAPRALLQTAPEMAKITWEAPENSLDVSANGRCMAPTKNTHPPIFCPSHPSPFFFFVSFFPLLAV